MHLSKSVCVSVLQNSLQGAPWGLMLALEQQLRELSLEQSAPLPPPPLPPTICDETSEDEEEDSRPSSGADPKDQLHTGG